ncbi:CDGSH iron-sulfur domain-containing protein [Leptospira sp. GIMC2001]|uniref:CDGSH iron-sulfur domain-containing protein n=1 Tax=Leptospira sp. GIMC2001 TaxID=1513297 RepID=UPI0023491FEF|nr:CDGSH iron-sulfur domain-containing protein [Leptospira sp. GIMC2001]WCL50913.1 CDGSH iron-sulfur domain-containing protein [Leptospira sp. GIMC2001]
MAEAPIPAQKSPYVLSMEEGSKKMWCSCGYSSSQPFCDGAHAKNETGMKPLKYVCDSSGEVAFCGCKQTKNPPFCDGSHNSL